MSVDIDTDARAVETDAHIAELAKDLPFHAPDPARRDAVRASLLQAAREDIANPARTWRVAAVGFVAGVIATAAVLVLVLRTDAPSSSAPIAAVAPTHAYATVESSSAAELEHVMTPTPTGTLETVRIRSGKLRLAVPAVPTGDRVQLATRDAQVEGTGAFDVEVVDDTLRSVTVARGSARVTVAGTSVFLAAGQTWRAPVITADVLLDVNATASATASDPFPGTAAAAAAAIAAAHPDDPGAAANARAAAAIAARAPGAPRTHVTPRPVAPEPTDVDAPERAPRAAVTASPDPAVADPSAPETGPTPPVEAPPATGPTPTERHFRAGWTLLRAGKHAQAVTELTAAAAGEGPLALDAKYFLATALVQIGRGTEAEQALVGFLDAAPTSPRRGRATILLARLLAQRGDRDGARNWYRSVASDRDPAVVAAATAGLAALDDK